MGLKLSAPLKCIPFAMETPVLTRVQLLIHLNPYLYHTGTALSCFEEVLYKHENYWRDAMFMLCNENYQNVILSLLGMFSR